MASKFKIAFLWLTVLLAIWVMVGGAWFFRSMEPSNFDLVLGLIVVPAIFVGTYFLLKKVFSKVLHLSPAHQTKDQEKETTEVPRQETTEPVSDFHIHILSGVIKVMPGGAQELLQACKDCIRPALDSKLVDEQGFPVMAARVAEIDDLDVLDWWDAAALDDLIPEGRAWVSGLAASQERELRLLADVMIQSAVELERYIFPTLANALGAEAISTVSEKVKALKALLPVTQVQINFGNSAWSQDDEYMVLAWARACLAQAAPSLSIDVRVIFSIETDKSEFRSPTALMQADASIWTQTTAGKGSSMQILLFASAHSSISQEDIDQLAAEGRLFSSRRREGLIAGEGAAALVLLHSDAQVSAFADELPFPVAAGQLTMHTKDLSVDLEEKGIPFLLTTSKVEASEVCKVVSDADNRAESALRTAMLLHQQFPDLSLDIDCPMVAIPSGNIGDVASLVSLALAAEIVVQEQKPVLALALASDKKHAAVLLRLASDSAVT